MTNLLINYINVFLFTVHWVGPVVNKQIVIIQFLAYVRHMRELAMEYRRPQFSREFVDLQQRIRGAESWLLLLERSPD